MQRKLTKMGKRSVKSNAVRKFATNGKISDNLFYTRDSFPDESNDSGLGSDTLSSLLDANDSSRIEESDFDCSSDSVDSGISEQSRLTRYRQLKTQTTLGLPMSCATLHVDSTLALSLNRKMHIQHKQSEASSGCFDEPPAKWRRVAPSAEYTDNATTGGHESRENILAQDSFHCGNSTGKDSLRNDFENRDSTANKDGNQCSTRDSYAVKGAPDQNSRNGDRIVALLSSSSNSLARKRPVKKPSLHVCFPSRSKDGKVELCILIQPEEQHRARYMTEGSRGSIKDEKGTGFPTVKLVGYNQPVVLQIFIGSDQGKIQPHLFYQACKVTGKNCTPCSERIIDGTCVIEINMTPETDMTVSCDCIGILKERNVDVEQRLPYFGLARCKKRSTKCRMVFRVNIPLSNGNFETLQSASSQILCTQSPGLPEICKKSLMESPMAGGSELFIIGKNFQKDAKIVFQQFMDEQMEPGDGKDAVIWEEIVDPDKEYAHQSHLVCSVPPYRTLDGPHPVKVFLSVLSGGKSSETHTFTYTPSHAVQKETFVHSPMQQAGNPSASLEIGHQFTKTGMDSPNPNMSPVMMSGNGDSALRSMLSPPAYMNGRCASPRQLSNLSIQLMPPSPSSTLSPGHANSLDSSSMGNPYNSAEPVDMASLMSNSCGPIMMSSAVNGHLSPLDHASSASSNASIADPSSPTQNITSNLLTTVHGPPKGMNLPGEHHHEEDLMSGINQLASEMVQAQEDAASSRVVRMTTGVVNRCTDLNSSPVLTPMANRFVQNCLSMLDVPMVPSSLVSQSMASGCGDTNMNTIVSSNSSVPSQSIVDQANMMMGHLSQPLMTKMEPMPSMEGLNPGLVTAMSGGAAPLPSSAEVYEAMVNIAMPICQAPQCLTSGESNCQLTVASLHQAGDRSLDVKPSLPATAHLDGVVNMQQRQSMDAAFLSTSAEPSDGVQTTSNCSLPNLVEMKVAPLVYTNAYDASAGSQSTAALIPSQLAANAAGDIASYGIAAENKFPVPSNLVLAPTHIKTEKPEVDPNMNCDQQSMTLAFSKLSDADLLSIINTSTFDTV